MKKLMKRGIALICMLAMLLSVLPAVSAAEDNAEFVVLSTTDMHGRCWDTNVLNDTSMNNSMLNVATAVAQMRETYGESMVLLDNGDTYQGTPVSTLQISNYTQGLTTDPNPMALSLQYIGYDLANLGNHEFNYAWSTMEDTYAQLASGDNGLPTVCANLYYDGSDGVHAAGENVLTPYIIKTLKDTKGNDVKVAIICFVTPDCTRWDVPDNYPGMRFSHPDNPSISIRWEAEKYVAEVESKEDPDFVIVAFHSGLGAKTADEDLVYGTNTENQVYSMIAGTSGIDMVIAGHDHSEGYSNNTYKNADGEDVLVVNGGGNSLTTSVFTVAADGTISLKSSANNKLSNYAADAGLKAIVSPYAAKAEEYVNNTCGTAIGTWNTTTKYYLEQSDTMDLIGRAQMAQGSIHLEEKYDTEEKKAALYAETGLTDLTVDLSSTSVVINGSYNVSAGDIAMKDIYRMYKYDNSLYLLPVTGAEIKDILEFNAATHLSVSIATGTPVFGLIGDNFTNPIFYGIDFKYDMSREKYDRVTDLKFADGREVEAEKVYILAVNNYHLGNASGPFSNYTTEDCIWSQTDDMGGGFVQDLIAEFLSAETEKNGGVAPAPSNWEIVYTGDIQTGVASGRFIGDLVENSSTLASDDQVMILHVASAQLVSNVATGSKLSPCADITVGDKQVGTNNESVLFTLVKGADGYYRLVDANGKYVTSGESGNSLTMAETESPYSLWEFEATDGGYYIHNVNAAYNGNTNQYLEYYSGAFTTYGIQSGGDAYLFQIYKLSAVSQCQHEKTELVGACEPTCDKNGHTGNIVCSDCGEILEVGQSIPALGHNYTGKEVVEPTCTTMGYTKNLCSRCDSFYRNEFVAALGHNYEDGVCTLCGEEDPSLEPDESDEPENSSVLDGYTDLAQGQWYSAGVTYALENGLMIGVAEGEFDPDGVLTRAMFVTILYRAAGSPDVSYINNPYYDVKDNSWYTNAIVWASANGIVNGVDINYFAPDEAITREQMVTILWRYSNKPEASVSVLNAYGDASRVSAYAKTAMAWAVEEGIINGMDGKLVPTANATRAQTAVIFYRYLMK